MKKIISVMLAIIMIFSISTISVSAMDSYVTNGMSSSTMMYRQPSEYCILIPETIDTASGQYMFQAGSINITDSEKIYVTVQNVDGNGRIEFTHENGKYTLSKDLIVEDSNPSFPVDTAALPENCVGYFAGNDMCSKIQFTVGEASYDCDYAKAGLYYATVEFNVNLVE